MVLAGLLWPACTNAPIDGDSLGNGQRVKDREAPTTDLDVASNPQRQRSPAGLGVEAVPAQPGTPAQLVDGGAARSGAADAAPIPSTTIAPVPAKPVFTTADAASTSPKPTPAPMSADAGRTHSVDAVSVSAFSKDAGLDTGPSPLPSCGGNP